MSPGPSRDGAAPALAVVIPTLDEAVALPRLLADLDALPGAGVAREIVVADGGSCDGTASLARAAGATVVRAPRGRASQIRAGVAATSAPWLLLLHADCRLTADAANALAEWLTTATPDESAHFAFALDAAGRFWRFLEWGQRWRERLTGLVYGDQGLVLSRRTWDAVGGVPDVPLMEDVALVDRIRARRAPGSRLHRLPAALPTSPRRWEEEGRFRGWIRNVLLVSLYRLGVSPWRLADLYPDRRTGAAEGAVGPGRDRSTVPGDATVVVFARAPRPGRVKTRLAADAGDAAALRVYRAMGRRVVDALRDGPWRLVVAGTPDDGLDAIAAWLEPEGACAPQRGDDLGARMHHALTSALETTARACVVGTDAPDVDAALVAEALAALDDHDLVLGPAEDGGYYLVAVDAPRPALFDDVPWSTGEVLAVTLERARKLGLRVRLLRPLRDVDTVDDVPGDLRPLLDPPAVPGGA